MKAATACNALSRAIARERVRRLESAPLPDKLFGIEAGESLFGVASGRKPVDDKGPDDA